MGAGGTCSSREDKVVSVGLISGLQVCSEGWNDECELLFVQCMLTFLLPG